MDDVDLILDKLLSETNVMIKSLEQNEYEMFFNAFNYRCILFKEFQENSKHIASKQYKLMNEVLQLDLVAKEKMNKCFAVLEESIVTTRNQRIILEQNISSVNKYINKEKNVSKISNLNTLR